MEFRVGLGFDIHRFAPGSPLVLGGVKIEFPMGLLGHSDGDALVHAVTDALLGAAGFRDIGFYFPDTDPSYRGIYSLVLLRQVGRWLREGGWGIGNIDITVIAQAPRLAPYIQNMREKMALALSIESSQIGIKATTAESTGIIGQGEGIAAYAVALLKGKDETL